MGISNLTGKRVKPIQDGHFWGCSRIGWGGGAGGKKATSPKNLSNVSYNDETWHSYTLPKGDPKSI